MVKNGVKKELLDDDFKKEPNSNFLCVVADSRDGTQCPDQKDCKDCEYNLYSKMVTLMNTCLQFL